EADDGAGVLAVRDALPGRQRGVLLQDGEHLLAGRRALGRERAVEGAEDVGLEADVGLHAQLLDRVGDRADVDVSHDPLLIRAVAAWARLPISAALPSCLWVAILHWLPHASSRFPHRPPQDISVR